MGGSYGASGMSFFKLGFLVCPFLSLVCNEFPRLSSTCLILGPDQIIATDVKICIYCCHTRCAILIL